MVVTGSGDLKTLKIGVKNKILTLWGNRQREKKNVFGIFPFPFLNFVVARNGVPSIPHDASTT